MTGAMRRTPLTEWHEAHGATFTDFFGWQMPVYYSGITEEHLHTRNSAGLFDLCHMGRVRLRGERVREFVDAITPADVASAKTGDVQYSFLLTEGGRTIDDITLYYGEDYALLIINAGNRERDIAWLREQAAVRGGVEVEDLSEAWGMIALQGPQSEAIWRAVAGDAAAGLKYYSFVEAELDGFRAPVIVSATGYTGEAGYEFYLPADETAKLWEQLWAAGGNTVKAIGLGARDSLRLEAAMPLYGHELTDDTTPLEAGLGRFVKLDKGDFVGRGALAEQKAAGLTRRLVGIELLARGPVARQGHAVHRTGGGAIGEVTSGVFSPTLQKVVALAYVAVDCAATGTELEVDIRGRRHAARVVKKPFYRREQG